MSELIRTLVGKGADIEMRSEGLTPLMIAAFRYKESTRVLLELGANPLALSDLKESALTIALLGGNDEAAHVLAPVSDRSTLSDGKTMLMWACKNDCPKAVEALVDPKEVDKVDADGRTAFDSFILSGCTYRTEIAHSLLRHADPWREGYRGLLPLFAVAADEYANDNNAKIVLAVVDAMRSRGRPGFDMLSALGTAVAVAKIAKNESLAKLLVPLRDAEREHLVLAEVSEESESGQKSRAEKSKPRL